MARLEQVLRGIKSTQAKDKRKEKPRLPISIDIVRKMKVAWQNNPTQDVEMLFDIFVGRTNCSVCPVSAVLAAKRVPRPDPLFIFSDGKPFTRVRFVLEVKRY